MLPILVVACVVIGLLWHFIGYADIPVFLYTSTFVLQPVSALYGYNYLAPFTNFPLVNADSTIGTQLLIGTSSGSIIALDFCNKDVFPTGIVILLN